MSFLNFTRDLQRQPEIGARTRFVYLEEDRQSHFVHQLNEMHRQVDRRDVYQVIILWRQDDRRAGYELFENGEFYILS